MGTKPSVRAAWWSRQPATTTAPSRSSAGPAAVPVDVGEEGMAGPAGAVGVERPLVRPPPRARPRRGPPPCARRGAGGRARGTDPASRARSGARAGGARSRCRRPRPGKASRQSRSASPSATRRDGDRVQPLARRVVVLPRHPDHDRVERLLERRRAAGDPAQERLGVRDRRRSGEGRDRRQLAAEIVQQPAAQPRREQREAAERRACDVPIAIVLVRVAAKAAGQRGGLSTSDVPITGTRAASPRSSATPSCQPRLPLVSSSESALAARSASGRRRRAARPARRAGRSRPR